MIASIIFIIIGFLFLIASLLAYIKGEHGVSDKLLQNGIILLGFGFVIKELEK